MKIARSKTCKKKSTVINTFIHPSIKQAFDKYPQLAPIVLSIIMGPRDTKMNKFSTKLQESTIE